MVNAFLSKDRAGGAIAAINHTASVHKFAAFISHILASHRAATFMAERIAISGRTIAAVNILPAAIRV